MTSVAQIIEEVRQVAEPLIQALGLELVDIEYQREKQGWVLRVYIDRVGGVNIEECVQVNRELSTILDVRDFIPNAYVLEVSSPGLNRPLKKPADFARYQGRLVKIKTWQPIGGEGRVFKAQLKGLEGEKVILQKGAEIIEIPLQAIAKANLEIEF